MARAADALFVATAGFALAAGSLAYVADRPAPPALFAGVSVALAFGPVFGALAQWLPSFAHPLAFSLLTAAARPATAGPAYGACLAWWVVNVVFEAGQHRALSGPLVDCLREWFGDAWLARQLGGFFLHGTFDRGDMVAATLGALGAAALVRVVHRRRARGPAGSTQQVAFREAP